MTKTTAWHLVKRWFALKRDSSNHCSFGASVHNGLMNNSGFSAVTHISRSHICDSLIEYSAPVEQVFSLGRHIQLIFFL